MKIGLDKYYTPVWLAERLIAKTFEVVGSENITDIIEPSAGNGSFSNQLDCRAIDIEPEAEGIERGDFLAIDIPYKKGRLVIGNPPYGDKMRLAKKFYEKSAEIADYIAFILPISQLNNNSFLYKFNLIWSEDLDEQSYSGRLLKCCFNIYKRPPIVRTKPKRKSLDGIKIYRDDCKGYDSIDDYDVRMCYWGDGSAGRIITDKNERYSGEFKIKVTHPKKDEIVAFIRSFDWRSYVKNIAMKRIHNYHIIEVLEDNIDGLKEKRKTLF